LKRGAKGYINLKLLLFAYGHKKWPQRLRWDPVRFCSYDASD